MNDELKKKAVKALTAACGGYLVCDLLEIVIAYAPLGTYPILAKRYEKDDKKDRITSYRAEIDANLVTTELTFHEPQTELVFAEALKIARGIWSVKYDSWERGFTLKHNSYTDRPHSSRLCLSDNHGRKRYMNYVGWVEFNEDDVLKEGLVLFIADRLKGDAWCVNLPSINTPLKHTTFSFGAQDIHLLAFSMDHGTKAFLIDFAQRKIVRCINATEYLSWIHQTSHGELILEGDGVIGHILPNGLECHSATIRVAKFWGCGVEYEGENKMSIIDSARQLLVEMDLTFGAVSDILSLSDA
jgi:hypothetical protein